MKPTKPTKPDSLSSAAAIMGRAGGRARLNKMTAEERRNVARLGGKASKGVPKKKRKDKQL